MANILSEQIQEINRLERRLRDHDHSKESDTETLQKSIELRSGQQYQVGQVALAELTANLGEATETQQMYLLAGPDQAQSEASQSRNAQVVLNHTIATLTSLLGNREPLYSESGVVIDSGSSTVTTNSFSWTENELAGAKVNLSDSSGVFKETRDISSNTSDTITMDSTPSFSDNEGSIYVWGDILFGSARFPWRRAYVDSATRGGVRFGVGPTGGGQNGLLYMRESDGELIWQRPDGSTEVLSIDEVAA